MYNKYSIEHIGQFIYTSSYVYVNIIKEWQINTYNSQGSIGFLLKDGLYSKLCLVRLF